MCSTELIADFYPFHTLTPANILALVFNVVICSYSSTPALSVSRHDALKCVEVKTSGSLIL